MSRSSNKRLLIRILADVLILTLIFNAHWYITILLIIISAVYFFPYLEILLFASILDAFYGSPRYFLFTIAAVFYLIVIHFLQGRILLKK